MGERRSPAPGERQGPQVPPEAPPPRDAFPPPPGPSSYVPPPSRDGGRRAQRRSGTGGWLSFFRELPGLILVAFLLALLIKSFIVQAFYIPSQSMEPTLQVGDRVLVNKFLYAFREPRRGEVIVFQNPNLDSPDRNPLSAVWHWVIEGLGVSADPEKDFIKRVVALPGETIEINGGRVFVDGQRIREPYLRSVQDRADFGPFTVPQGHLFVMGDNRANSQDSRSSLGPVPRDKVVGKAFIVLWPPSSFRWLSGG